MQNTWLLIVCGGLAIWSIRRDRASHRRRVTELERQAHALGGEPIGSNGLRCRTGGVDVEATFVTRGQGSNKIQWTEITAPLPPKHPLTIRLRSARSSDARNIRAGRALDLELGDPGFDDQFLVEAAPSDVVRALFDPVTRACLMKPRTQIELETCEVDGRPTLRLSLLGWVEVSSLADLIELVGRVSSGVRAAFATSAPTNLVGDAIYRGHPDASGEQRLAARRDRELARLDEIEERRRQHERSVTRISNIVAFGAFAVATAWTFLH